MRYSVLLLKQNDTELVPDGVTNTHQLAHALSATTRG